MLRRFECLDVGISYLQIMVSGPHLGEPRFLVPIGIARLFQATVFTFDSRYLNHSSHYDVIVAISNIINIDVDFVSPSCTLPGRVWGCARLTFTWDTSAIESTFYCLRPGGMLRVHWLAPLHIWCALMPGPLVDWPTCRCGRGEPSPGADVAGVSPFPVQMWQERARSGCRRGMVPRPPTS